MSDWPNSIPPNARRAAKAGAGTGFAAWVVYALIQLLTSQARMEARMEALDRTLTTVASECRR